MKNSYVWWENPDKFLCIPRPSSTNINLEDINPDFHQHFWMFWIWYIGKLFFHSLIFNQFIFFIRLPTEYNIYISILSFSVFLSVSMSIYCQPNCPFAHLSYPTLHFQEGFNILRIVYMFYKSRDGDTRTEIDRNIERRIYIHIDI